MKKNAIFVILFFVVLAGFAIATFLLPAREFSDNENRNLAQMPVLSVDTLLSGEFQSGLSDFLSDQIPGREFWIRLNTGFKKLMGKTEINGVWLGDDGYYFQVFTDDSYSTSRTQAIFALINQFAGKLENKVTIMPVPTPGCVLSDKLPKNAPIYDDYTVWQALKAATPNCVFIDLEERFIKLRENHTFYYRTDHHWTAEGAYFAYTLWCENHGLQVRTPEEFGITTVSDSFLGTIYSKTLDAAAQPEEIKAPQNLPKVTVTVDEKTTLDSVYAEEFLSKKDQYAYFFGGNYGKVEITTEATGGKTLVVIKDSFANSFVPYLLYDYERIIMLDLRYFNGVILQEIPADAEVLFLYEMTNLLTDTGINKLAR